MIWVGAAWLAATVGVTATFFGARRSRLLHDWLFGERPSAEMHRLVKPQASQTTEQPRRLAA
jgi:hypothetical protein